VVVWEHRSERRLSSTISGLVVLCHGRKAKATQHSQRVRIEGQKPSDLRQHEDLVGAWFPNHGEFGQGASGLGRGEAQRCLEIAIPSTEDELSRFAQPGGSNSDRNGPAQARDPLQLGRWSGYNGRWPKANLSSQGREGSAALAVGHEIPYLLPEDQVEGIPTDRGRRLTVAAP
jgi:hypothetical protein